jgi:hypothetical protein
MQRPINEVIDGVVTSRSSGASAARQTMCSFWFDLGTTWTLMLLTKFGAKPETNRDPDGLIVEAQST